MKTLASAMLLQKAMKVVSVIEDAQSRIEGTKKEIQLFGLVSKNWREELSIFPLGKPSAAEQERTKHNLEITKAAHARLCAYYGRILSRLIDLQ